MRITTDAGEIIVPVADTGAAQTLPLPEGRTDSADHPSAPRPRRTTRGLALAEVRVPGSERDAGRSVTPEPPGPVDVYAFDAPARPRPAA